MSFIAFGSGRACLRSAVSILCVSLCACTSSGSRSGVEQVAATTTSDAVAALEHAQLARIAARDESGRPRLLVGQGTSPGTAALALDAEQVARVQLTRHARLLGLGADALRGTQLSSRHRLATGATVWQYAQSLQGVDVFGARASLLLDRDKNLVALANHLTPAVHQANKRSLLDWKASAQQAVAWAYALHAPGGVAPAAVHELTTRGAWQEFSVSTGAGQPQALQAAAKRVAFPEGDALVPAYHVELLLHGAANGRADEAFAYVLSASDGRTLYAATLTAADAFNYRVWVDGDGAPTDGPLQDATPYPGALPDKRALPPAPQVLIAMEGFNHNPEGKPDPWLTPTDTVTFGNNVSAYSDRNQFTDLLGFSRGDGFDDGVDVRADVTAPNVFDRTYDPTKAPNSSPDQVKAAVTQIFYVTNWLHDYWYDSGFDEQAQNAQRSNYDRGGIDNDPLLAEAQDSADDGASNNANMSTFSDGRSPRMQMYVWSGAANRSLATEPSFGIEDGLGAAGFGPQTFDHGADKLGLTLVDDGSSEPPPSAAADGAGSTADACQKPNNVSGKLAVIDRGACTFELKVKNAQAAGALAVLLLDNTAGHNPPNPASESSDLTLPVLSLSYEDGQKLKTLLSDAATPVTATQFSRGPEPLHDGTIDNTIVAHEWGHYLHHRLVLCSSVTCNGMSEGWADFIAMMMVIRPGDTFPGQVYPMAQYAAAGLNKNASYFGIRRAPYSVELDKNPFTFQHVRRSAKLPTSAPLATTASDMAEVHNVGEIWAETLFEAYTHLLEAGQQRGVPFAALKRHMADYIVAGMKAAPVDPTFVEQRDAILLVAHAMGKDDPARAGDFAALAAGFAKRGLGIGATAPPIGSRSLNEAVESFVFKGEVAIKDLKLDDALVSCDRDGILDASEAGLLTLTLANTGWLPLAQGQLQVVSSDPAVKITPTPTIPLNTLQPYDETKLSFGVVVDPRKQGIATVHVVISSTDPDAANANVEYPFDLRYNYDDVSASATHDDVESAQSAWVVSPDAAWERVGDHSNHVWHADDLGSVSDQSLVSPELVVSEDEPLLITFSHRYAFELGQAVTGGPSVGFDGGVIEITRDDGAHWQDISRYTAPAYTGKIFSVADLEDPKAKETNVLAGREAFIGASPGYPKYNQVSLDLGKALAGKTIKLRFRVATDEGTGAAGWDIDDIAFGTAATPSLSNTPFSSIRDNAGSCASPAAP